jgi:MFS family permease
MLANWLYFLALGLVIPVLGRVISTVVNTDGSPNVSPASSIVGGDVEALDKLCTFLFVGFLGALSDVLGRKPLMAYSALGFSLTCYIQVRAAALCTAAPQRCSPAAPQPRSPTAAAAAAAPLRGASLPHLSHRRSPVDSRLEPRASRCSS